MSAWLRRLDRFPALVARGAVMEWVGVDESSPMVPF
jgi:hypothetical protein